MYMYVCVGEALIEALKLKKKTKTKTLSKF